MTLHPKERMLALLAARQREDTEEFKEIYRHRAGIEGTHSQGVRTMGLRRSRYIGLPKTSTTEYPAGVNSTTHRYR